MVVASGDGSVKLFDINVNEFPVQTWKEHNREVYAVSWNLVSKDTFASSSWDGTIKIVRGFLRFLDIKSITFTPLPRITQHLQNIRICQD